MGLKPHPDRKKANTKAKFSLMFAIYSLSLPLLLGVNRPLRRKISFICAVSKISGIQPLLKKYITIEVRRHYCKQLWGYLWSLSVYWQNTALRRYKSHWVYSLVIYHYSVWPLCIDNAVKEYNFIKMTGYVKTFLPLDDKISQHHESQKEHVF